MFAVIDLKSSFQQIPLKELDIEKTIFSVNNGKYEFTRLLLGLKNAPSILQRSLYHILREHIGNRCYAHIDVIIIVGKTEAEHLENLEAVLKTLVAAKIEVQLAKSEFFSDEV